MLDEASRARLDEMGVDVYLLRAAGAVDRATLASASDASGVAHGRARVALIAHTGSASGRALLAQVVRAFALARIEAVIVPDAAQIGDAAGLVVFGTALAREVGAELQIEQPKPIEWVGVAELADIGGNAAAKRALWIELKRVVSALAKSSADPRLT